MKGKILIALGGNALLRKGEKGEAKEQIKHVQETCRQFLNIIKEGYALVVTHGNGPQVGNILLQNEIAKKSVPSMPLDICGAESQGMIGYMIQRSLGNQLKKEGKDIPVATILTQTLVEIDDPAFKNPTKPIGPFYGESEARTLQKERGWTIVEQVGKGFRRVVPSPQPKDIVEGRVIKKLVSEKMIVVACGGGGIPVVEENGGLRGVEAVIDKDLTAEVLARVIGADILMILTDVEKVVLNFGRPNQQELNKLTISQAQVYLEEGQFPKGSMGPKVEAACKFLKEGGKKAIITSLESSRDALLGKTGTIFTS